MAVYKPRKEASDGTNLANALISDVWPPELPKKIEVNFCCLSHPACSALLRQPELNTEEDGALSISQMRKQHVILGV